MKTLNMLMAALFVTFVGSSMAMNEKTDVEDTRRIVKLSDPEFMELERWNDEFVKESNVKYELRDHKRIEELKKLAGDWHKKNKLAVNPFILHMRSGL